MVVKTWQRCTSRTCSFLVWGHECTSEETWKRSFWKLHQLWTQRILGFPASSLNGNIDAAACKSRFQQGIEILAISARPRLIRISSQLEVKSLFLRWCDFAIFASPCLPPHRSTSSHQQIAHGVHGPNSSKKQVLYQGPMLVIPIKTVSPKPPKTRQSTLIHQLISKSNASLADLNDRTGLAIASDRFFGCSWYWEVARLQSHHSFFVYDLKGKAHFEVPSHANPCSKRPLWMLQPLTSWNVCGKKGFVFCVANSLNMEKGFFWPSSWDAQDHWSISLNGLCARFPPVNIDSDRAWWHLAACTRKFFHPGPSETWSFVCKKTLIPCHWGSRSSNQMALWQ